MLPCHNDPNQLNTTSIFLGLKTYLNPQRLTIFSTDGVSGFKNLNTCLLDFCVMSVVINLEFTALFTVFNLWNGPGVIFAFYLIFNF